jgi:hypothetical protein
MVGASISNTATLLMVILPLDIVMMLPYVSWITTPPVFPLLSGSSTKMNWWPLGVLMQRNCGSSTNDHGQSHIALGEGDQYLIPNLWDKVKAITVARVAVAHAAFDFHLIVTPDELDHETAFFANILGHGGHSPFFYPVKAFVSEARTR